MYYTVLSLVLQSSWWGRWGWLLYLVVLPVSKLCSVALPRVAVDWSALWDCGISWSYCMHGSLKLFLVLNLNYRNPMLFFFKENYNFPRLQRGSNGFQGGAQLFPWVVQWLILYKNPNTLWFSRGGGGFAQPAPLPSGSSHDNSLFRCFVHGLKRCMPCAFDIIIKLFSLSFFLFMNLWSNFKLIFAF